MSSSVTRVNTLLALLGVFCEDPCHYFRTVDCNVHWKCVGLGLRGFMVGRCQTHPGHEVHYTHNTSVIQLCFVTSPVGRQEGFCFFSPQCT